MQDGDTLEVHQEQIGGANWSKAIATKYTDVMGMMMGHTDTLKVWGDCWGLKLSCEEDKERSLYIRRGNRDYSQQVRDYSKLGPIYTTKPTQLGYTQQRQLHPMWQQLPGPLFESHIPRWFPILNKRQYSKIPKRIHLSNSSEVQWVARPYPCSGWCYWWRTWCWPWQSPVRFLVAEDRGRLPWARRLLVGEWRRLDVYPSASLDHGCCSVEVRHQLQTLHWLAQG